MRPLRFLLTPLLLLAGGCQPAPSSLTPAQREALAGEVRSAAQALTEAMNAHDPERILGFYADSEAFIYVGCTDLIFGSRFFKGIFGPFYLDNPDLTFQREILGIQILKPATAVITLQGASSEVEGLFWTQTLVREEDGRWLIRHEHASWPGCDSPPPLHPTGSMPDSFGDL